MLQDNYCYLVCDKETNYALAIDPADAKEVLRTAASAQVEIKGVFTTHHHEDHAGGNEDMARTLPAIPIYGPADRRIPRVTHEVSGGDTLAIGSLRLGVLDTSAHTLHHLSLVVEAPGVGQLAVFTGDSVFVGGCGRLFEGSPAQMYDTVVNVIGRLPADACLYPGHEYSLSNLLFGAVCDTKGDNRATVANLRRVESLRQLGLPTVPTTVGVEQAANVFMRAGSDSELARLRAAKDVWKGL